ncbi:MAG: rod shape-determining protein MreC [Lachnospiraceae bacterium]|nr:rod shape-determining protein MreC [Bacillota bacterium]MCI6594219.1 rod shape-determining protein MreC [Bacillota bacterium]MDD7252981.1 rod shape-determining protein MreC [Bacillota bacterium]MDY2949050.1 rod shape-determining protein MreC [Lachnospiraceae bacterium]
MSSGPIRRREPFRPHIPGRYLLLLVTALCVGMILTTYYTDVLNGPLSGFANYIVIPFQDGVSKAGEWLIKREQLVSDIKELQKENESLRQENEELSVTNNALLQEKHELTELRNLYQLDQTYADFPKTGCRIIAKENGSWYHSFVIDKGSEDGLSVDMNVLADGGLVGRITYIGRHWSRVQAVIDDNSNVSATVLSSQKNLIVSGNLTLYEEGTISFSELADPDDLVKVGDSVVTSNISDKYLPGILIGYISEIQTDSNNLTKSGRITPAVDFSRLDTVLVIQKLKQTAEDDG